MIYVFDFSIHNQFNEKFKIFSKKMFRIICNWCDLYKNQFKNITRMKIHLFECISFFIHANNVNHFFVVEFNVVKFKRKHENKTSNNNSISKRQNILSFAKMIATKKNNFDILITRAIIAKKKSLNLYENSNMTIFLNVLNSTYKSFFRTTIFTTLFDRVYEKKHRQIHSITNSNDNLNFIIDEFFNVNQNRMYVFIAQIFEYFFFHLDSKDMFFFFHTIENFASRIAKKMMYWNDNKSENINSFCIDEINVIRKIWKKIEIISIFKHVFFVSCDNHEIQFLVKNIVTKLFWFVRLFKRIHAIINYFHRNDKCTTCLRNHQRVCYNRIYVMMLSVIIRWNSQINHFWFQKSILNIIK